jgi:hypothetical protein
MGPIGPLIAGSTLMFTLVTICGSLLFTVVVTGAVIFVIYRVMKGMGPNRQILQTGIPAQATIRQVWQTGTYINMNPQVGMQLEVRPPNGAPYVAQVTAVVPMINIPQFQPGTVVPVKISPTDPSRVELDVYGQRP